MSSAGKILGIGSAILDILIRVDDPFITRYSGGEKGGRVMLEPVQLERLIGQASTFSVPVCVPGGSASNTIAGLAHLGIKTALSGMLGNDAEGKLYESYFRTVGCDTALFRYHSSLRTGRCLSLITPDSERTMRTDLGASASFSAEDLSVKDFAGVTHVLTEGFFLEQGNFLEEVYRKAKSAGASVSLDLSSFEIVRSNKRKLDAILEQYVDLVFANEAEATAFSGTDDPEKALDILSMFCETAVVKLGEKGSMVRRNGKTVQVSAKTVAAVDTTGAGDLWQAGFLYGYMNGASPEQCARYGSVVAAEAVQVVGARIPDERWTDIREEIQQIERNN